MPEAQKIREMFRGIAGRYDVTNTVLSAGIHHLWRSQVVEAARPQTGARILDCATGTGDLAIALAKAVGPTGHVSATDFCEEMMTAGPEKAKRAGVGDRVVFSAADVTKLPFENDSFDLATISFGIRNVENAPLGLKEMARVVRPGGRIAVLEFGQPTAPVVASAYRWYSDRVLPTLGGWLTGDRAAYRYLQSSSAAFPFGPEFEAMLTATGALTPKETRSLSFGVAYLYIAEKTGQAACRN
jgi:demethylmenaquinone methyltransferase/2-methoxy-6-polyprenyl-1,4-benzoquinol methylase